MRKFLAVLGAMLALASWGVGAQLLAPPPVRPDAMMNALTLEVTGILRQDHAAGRVTDLSELVEKRIVPVFDFARMTRIAVARNWRVASPEQQALLAAQFKTLLIRTYTRTLLEFRDEAIDYKPVRAAPGETEVTVRSAMRRPGIEPLTIDYDMADGMAGWQVYDVKVAGVSLVLAYRDSFATLVRSGGIDGLIKTLEDKNRQNGSAARAPDAARFAPVFLIYGVAGSSQR